MGISERKKKEKEIRRNDIIDAAEKVFFSKGYDYSTMDEVAKEAEFSKRTVYVYFNSKEQIYFEIMVRGYKLLIKMLELEFQNIKEIDALEKIKHIGRILYNFSNKYPNYFKAIMEYENGELDFANGISDKSREECYALGEKVLGYLINTLKNGVKEGSLRSELEVVNTALVLWSCSIGIFNTFKKKSRYITNYHERKPDDLIFEAFDLLVKSIKNENGESKK